LSKSKYIETLGVPICIPARDARSEGEKEFNVFFLSNPAQAPVGRTGSGGAAEAANELNKIVVTIVFIKIMDRPLVFDF